MCLSWICLYCDIDTHVPMYVLIIDVLMLVIDMLIELPWADEFVGYRYVCMVQ